MRYAACTLLYRILTLETRTVLPTHESVHPGNGTLQHVICLYEAAFPCVFVVVAAAAVVVDDDDDVVGVLFSLWGTSSAD